MTRRNKSQIQQQPSHGLLIPSSIIVSTHDHRRALERIQQLEHDNRQWALMCQFGVDLQRQIDRLNLLITEIVLLGNTLGTDSRLHAALVAMDADESLAGALVKLFETVQKGIQSDVAAADASHLNRSLADFVQSLRLAVQGVQNGTDNGSALSAWITLNQPRMARVIEQAVNQISAGGRRTSPIHECIFQVGYVYYQKYQYDRTVWADTADAIWKSVNVPESEQTEDQRAVFQHWTSVKPDAKQRRDQCKAVFSPPNAAGNGAI